MKESKDPEDLCRRCRRRKKCAYAKITEELGIHISECNTYSPLEGA
ncbi:MAG: hypothetical protein QXM00_10170 [Candidatus Bathyarchaeia archaeon]